MAISVALHRQMDVAMAKRIRVCYHRSKDVQRALVDKQAHKHPA